MVEDALDVLRYIFDVMLARFFYYLYANKHVHSFRIVSDPSIVLAVHICSCFVVFNEGKCKDRNWTACQLYLWSLSFLLCVKKHLV